MTIVLAVLMALFYLQGLAKFGLWLLVPYSTRIRRISSYYARDQRVISLYDTVTLVCVVAVVVLQFASGMNAPSFVAGLLVGMNLIQIFFHRFNRPLPDDRRPPAPAPPNMTMSYAIQARPALGWREIIIMAVLSAWALYVIVAQVILG
ncbi:hypothetical protein GBF35_26700 [Nonomuraea phyllanthi]|uniref:hypothetical protein n=1 Tax=Nonomuraea phyllanthi TaxID=2219224 RepID=UPI0012932528|nr:hypothetical protein [Nonomuraea phyllanthi]QFY09760.1 hypothetical protein GBF35_26700 [Nonomuraea phyllanthi]